MRFLTLPPGFGTRLWCSRRSIGFRLHRSYYNRSLGFLAVTRRLPAQFHVIIVDRGLQYVSACHEFENVHRVDVRVEQCPGSFLGTQ